MRSDGNGGGSPNYEPNSFGRPVEQSEVKPPPLPISGDADRYEARERVDDFKQPSDLYRLLPEDEQKRLIDNLVENMESVDSVIQARQIEHFYKTDPEYGRGVADLID